MKKKMCNICDTVFYTNRDVEKHMKSKHDLPKPGNKQDQVQRLAKYLQLNPNECDTEGPNIGPDAAGGEGSAPIATSVQQGQVIAEAGDSTPGGEFDSVIKPEKIAKFDHGLSGASYTSSNIKDGGSINPTKVQNQMHRPVELHTEIEIKLEEFLRSEQEPSAGTSMEKEDASQGTSKNSKIASQGDEIQWCSFGAAVTL